MKVCVCACVWVCGCAEVAHECRAGTRSTGRTDGGNDHARTYRVHNDDDDDDDDDEDDSVCLTLSVSLSFLVHLSVCLCVFVILRPSHTLSAFHSLLSVYVSLSLFVCPELFVSVGHVAHSILNRSFAAPAEWSRGCSAAVSTARHARGGCCCRWLGCSGEQDALCRGVCPAALTRDAPADCASGRERSRLHARQAGLACSGTSTSGGREAGGCAAQEEARQVRSLWRVLRTLGK
jgi:hypothetical protein